MRRGAPGIGAAFPQRKGSTLAEPQGQASGAPRRKGRERTDAAPAVQRLAERRVLDPGHHRVLCYGCGRGADVSWLRRRGFEVDGYDPHPPFGYASPPEGLYDYVLMVFVMARLRTDENRRKTIAKAFEYVRPGGHLVIVSRNWARLAAETGGDGYDGAAEYMRGLLSGCDAESIAIPELETRDRSISALARRAGVYQPRNPVEWVDTQAGIDRVCAELLHAPAVGLDVETTLDAPRALCTIQLGVPGKTWILDALAIEDYGAVRALMEDERVEKVIHNAAFEEDMLAKHRIRIVNVFDTLPASRAKHRKSAVSGHTLGEVCERELGIFLDKTLQTSDWTARPLSDEQLAYAAIDAEVLIDLHAVFKPPEPPKTLDLFENL